MSQHRPFAARDIAPTVIGVAFGLFFGFMGVLCIALLVEGFWIIMLALLPLLVFQMAVIFGADWLMKRYRAAQPAPPPIPWLRHHGPNLGAALGVFAAGLSLIVNGPLLGATA